MNCYGHGHLVCKFPINVTVPLGRIVGVGFAAWLADLLGRASGQAPGPRSGALQARGCVSDMADSLGVQVPRAT